MKLFGKPSKKKLAEEIDTLNAALSNKQLVILQHEATIDHLVSERNAVAVALTRTQQALAGVDQEALAEARRLAALHTLGIGASRHALSMTAEWLANGQWPDENTGNAESKKAM